MGQESGLRERKKEQTKRELFAHALRLFEAKGFDETTIEDIAAAANVAPRTFFRYFATKEKLFSLGQEEEDETLRATLASRRPGEDDISLLLRAFHAMLKLEHIDPKQSGVMMAVVLNTPSLRARTLEEMLRMERLIAEGLVGRKASRAEMLRARMLASAAISMFFTALLVWVEDGQKGDPFEAVEASAPLLRTGFVRRG
ncbi:MAG: TetR family transcriptional regulator [Deltaproteobacteria bacterium]|nr:TetR family transcriptional regulator [Deltaproteobacteria bacterium]